MKKALSHFFWVLERERERESPGVGASLVPWLWSSSKARSPGDLRCFRVHAAKGRADRYLCYRFGILCEEMGIWASRGGRGRLRLSSDLGWIGGRRGTGWLGGSAADRVISTVAALCWRWRSWPKSWLGSCCCGRVVWGHFSVGMSLAVVGLWWLQWLVAGVGWWGLLVGWRWGGPCSRIAVGLFSSFVFIVVLCCNNGNVYSPSCCNMDGGLPT